MKKGAYACKVYVVQKADRQGNLMDVLAVKLTHSSAHAIARRNAPAKVICVMADKDHELNALGAGVSHPM